MSMSWHTPEMSECEHGKPPSFWWPVAALVVILAGGIVITVFTWEGSKTVISGEFLFRALVLPLFVWGVVGSMIYISYEDWTGRVDYWNFLCRSHRRNWRCWTQSQVVVLGSVALTPEPELAERLLGLEGDAPINPGKVLSLSGLEAAPGASRLAQVLEKLIAPFANRISHLADIRTIEVVLHSGEIQDLIKLRTVWRKLGLSNLVTTRLAPPAKEPAAIAPWWEQP